MWVFLLDMYSTVIQLIKFISSCFDARDKNVTNQCNEFHIFIDVFFSLLFNCFYVFAIL